MIQTFFLTNIFLAFWLYFNGWYPTGKTADYLWWKNASRRNRKNAKTKELSVEKVPRVVDVYSHNHTVRCSYKVVKFLRFPDNRHPIARPRGYGCLVWDWSMFCVEEPSSLPVEFNILGPRQNDQHLTDGILNAFFKKKLCKFRLTFHWSLFDLGPRWNHWWTKNNWKWWFSTIICVTNHVNLGVYRYLVCLQILFNFGPHWPNFGLLVAHKWLKMVISDHYLKNCSLSPFQTWCIHLWVSVQNWFAFGQCWPSFGPQ